MNRLLNDDDARPQSAQCGVSRRRLPEFPERSEALEILIPIERDKKIAARLALQQIVQRPQPRKVTFRFRVQFDLEIAQTIGADGTFQILWQTVVCAFARR